MTKAILISVQPQHVVNILNGKKTIELRKVIPNWVKEEVAKGNTVKFLIYCTKSSPYVMYESGDYDDGDMAKSYAGYSLFTKQDIRDWCIKETPLNGKIIASFDVHNIHLIISDTIDKKDMYHVSEKTLKEACVTYDELMKYGNNKNLYGLQISNLKVIEPMELSELYNPNLYATIDDIKEYEEKNQNDKSYRISKPPKNMMTVWYKNNE